MFPPPRKWLPPTNAYKGVFSVQHARPSTGSQAPSPRCDCVKRSTACSFSHFWFSGRERGLPIHTISTILILSSVPEWRYSSNLFLDWVTSRENSVSLLSLPPYHLFLLQQKSTSFFSSVKFWEWEQVEIDKSKILHTHTNRSDLWLHFLFFDKLTDKLLNAWYIPTTLYTHQPLEDKKRRHTHW